MELGCQQVDFLKLGHSLSECTEFIGRHYLLIQLITVKGFRHFTIKKNCSSQAPRTCFRSIEQRVKLRLLLRLTRSLRTFTPWNSKDITNIEYGFAADFYFVFPT